MTIELLVAVFFDLLKSYDTTWKYGILKDLHNMGLRGNLPIFIGNFLSDSIDLPLSMLSKGNYNILSTDKKNGPLKTVLPFSRIRL